MYFNDLLKNSKFVNSVYAVAAIGLGLIFFFKEPIEKLALAGDSATLNLLLAFLFFIVVCVVCAAWFFGETEASKSKNAATLKDVKNFDGSQKGIGNELDAQKVEGGSFHQDSRQSPTAETDPQKKTPPQI